MGSCDPRMVSVPLGILSRSPAFDSPDSVTSVEMGVGSGSDSVVSGPEQRGSGVGDGRRIGGSN